MIEKPAEKYSEDITTEKTSAEHTHTPPSSLLTKITRRNFLGTTFLGSLALLTAKLRPQRQEASAVAEFMLERNVVPKREVYLPPDPENIFSQEVLDRIYVNLRLEKKYPQTLTPEVFKNIMRRPSRLAVNFFRTNAEDPAQQEKEFAEFAESFFELFEGYCEYMETDFVGALLAFQISGDNNNSLKLYNRDVTEERVRSGSSLAQIFSGQRLASLGILALNSVEKGAYYAMPRLEGPTSIGIHDIEFIEVIRALLSLKETSPEKWSKILVLLKKNNPRFSEIMFDYAETYNNFDSYSQSLTQEIKNEPDLLSYLKKYQDPDFLRKFLGARIGRVDAYQFSRTTTFWAHLTETESRVASSFYTARRSQLEKKALEMTIETYAHKSDSLHFFLDQICNPKFQHILEKDADNGSMQAKELLALAQEFTKRGNEVIAQTRVMEATVADKEFDLEFQLITGIAYARSVLQEGQSSRTQQLQKKLQYDDPNILARDAFHGLAKREAAPAWQLTGHRPLHRATLTFAPREMLDTAMAEYIKNVYMPVAEVSPETNFKKFISFFVKLLEEPVAQGMMGTSRYKLDGDTQTERFIKLAKDHGAYKNIITFPHSSWMRCLEAVAGYITDMSSDMSS